MTVRLSVAGAAHGGASAHILALAPNSWGGQWMNRQQILSRLASRYDILYSTGPWSVWDRHTEEFRRARTAGRIERIDGVRVDHPPKYLLSWPTHPGWEQLVTSLSVRRWRRHLQGPGKLPLVGYVFHPDYLPYAEGLRADLLVYNPYDLFSRTPGWGPRQTDREQRLLELADLVITSSEPARSALGAMTKSPVHCVPNGVDAAAFALGCEQPTPADLAAIPHPRLGYVGSVNRKVDLPLVAALAEREPHWHFVFVGPVFSHDDVTGPALARCHDLPNVHFLRSRSRDELPAAMAALDVGLMCYRTGTWMDFAYPLKLHEYLATALPVVSAELPAVRQFDKLVDIAGDVDDWHATLRRVLAGNARGSAAERQAEAARNTWESRVERIAALLSEALDRH